MKAKNNLDMVCSSISENCALKTWTSEFDVYKWMKAPTQMEGKCPN